MDVVSIMLRFGLAAAVIWVAGIWLTRSTDAIDTHFKLGSAFGGLLLLGIATSLPEIAITVSAAAHGHYGVVVGNLLGGIALQTVLLALFDAKMSERRSLTFSATSLLLVLEASIVILVTVLSVLAMRTPILVGQGSVSLASLAIAVAWMVGMWIVYRARKGLPWKSEAIDAAPGRAHHERRSVINHNAFKNRSATWAISVFGVASVATLVAGVVLEESGTALANHYGIASGLFAATFIALATALPEISSGLTSIRLKDYQLAMSDIFGGNAFMPALFVVGDLVAGKQILRAGTGNDVWFAALGVLLTTIYAIGLIVRPRKTVLRLGPDSLLVVGLYVVAIAALAASS